MKTETSSSLNPYAAAYIPLSRRAVIGENKNCSLTEKDSDVVSETLWEDHFKNMTLNQSKASQNYIDHGILASELTKGNTFHSSYGSSSQNSSKITEKQIMDDEFDMGLAYLQMKFPGISDNSLYEIYLANSGDLEATIDMLHQLELYSGDSFENLPDTLDIGDVSESGSSSDSASQKLKNVTAEVAGSSSGSSEPARDGCIMGQVNFQDK